MKQGLHKVKIFFRNTIFHQVMEKNGQILCKLIFSFLELFKLLGGEMHRHLWAKHIGNVKIGGEM